MPFNGSGGFVSIGAPDFPAVDATTILASQYNNQLNDIFTGLGNTVTRDGQSPALANLPMGGFNFTNMGDPSAAGQALVRGQATTMGTLLADLGSAGTPSYAFLGDLNTGAYSPGADQYAISTAATQRYVVGVAGNHVFQAPTSGIGVQVLGLSGGSSALRVGGTTESNNGQVLQVYSNKAVFEITPDGVTNAVGTTISWSFNAGGQGPLRFVSSVGEAARFDPSNRFLLGRTTDSGLGLFQASLGSVGEIADFSSTFSGVASVRVRSAGAEQAVLLLQNSATGTALADGFRLGIQSTGVGYISQQENQPLLIEVNSLLRATFPAAGGLNLAEPTSGVTLTVNSRSGTAAINTTAPAATNGFVLQAGGSTTGALYSDWQNTSGYLRFGVESSAGAVLFTGTSAYGSVIGSNNNTDFFLGTNGNARFGVKGDGRLFGRFMHNVGTVTGTTDQFIASGTYTPTLTNSSNVAASSNAGTCSWIRVGNVVTVQGAVNVDPTAGSAATVLGISLPIASNFTSTNHCTGTAARDTSATAVMLLGLISGDTTNDRANLNFFCDANSTNLAWYFTFTYEVL